MTTVLLVNQTQLWKLRYDSASQNKTKLCATEANLPFLAGINYILTSKLLLTAAQFVTVSSFKVFSLGRYQHLGIVR